MQSSDRKPETQDLDAGRFLAIAKAATATASELVRSKRPELITWKGDRDVTSDVDVAVETVIRDFLHEHTPEAGFLGEEEGGNKPDHGYHWILDPIDGTVNFLHGVPLCAISLSLVLDRATLVSVIDLPFLNTQYSALRGHGSYANGHKIHVSATRKLNDALISVDQYTFGDGSRRTNHMRHHLIGQLAPRVQRIRMLGTSAIDLAWTAHGRLDACVMLGNKPWDTSAGVLIAQEAGAQVIDLDGSEHSAASFGTIAVTPSLHHELMTIVRSTSYGTTAPSSQ